MPRSDSRLRDPSLLPENSDTRRSKGQEVSFIYSETASLTSRIYSSVIFVLTGLSLRRALFTNIPMVLCVLPLRVLTGTLITISSDTVYFAAVIEYADSSRSNTVTDFLLAACFRSLSISPLITKKRSVSDSGCTFGREPLSGSSVTGTPSANNMRYFSRPLRYSASLSSRDAPLRSKLSEAGVMPESLAISSLLKITSLPPSNMIW